MEWIKRWRSKRRETARYTRLFEQLHKQRERWWFTVLQALLFGVTMLPLTTDKTLTALRVWISAGSGVLYLVTEIFEYRRLAPLTRWRRLSVAGLCFGLLGIGLGIVLWCRNRPGDHENVLQLVLMAVAAWSLFVWCRVQLYRLRRQTAAEIDALRRERQRRKRMELL